MGENWPHFNNVRHSMVTNEGLTPQGNNISPEEEEEEEEPPSLRAIEGGRGGG